MNINKINEVSDKLQLDFKKLLIKNLFLDVCLNKYSNLNDYVINELFFEFIIYKNEFNLYMHILQTKIDNDNICFNINEKINNLNKFFNVEAYIKDFSNLLDNNDMAIRICIPVCIFDKFLM